MKNFISFVTGQILTVAPKIIYGLLVFIGFWLAGVLLQKIVRRFAHKRNLNRELLAFIGRTVKISMIVFGLITALGTFGINISALVAGLGLTGFALGFAFKDILSNIISGILILIYHPFKLEDRIVVKSYEGIVKNIDLRYTTLLTENGKILVPNSTLFTNSISVLGSSD